MKYDIKQEITNKIIELMESSQTDNGKLWKDAIVDAGMPYNAKTGLGYSGVNILLLCVEKEKKNYAKNAWLTYKQAQELGGQVRKGEKGIKCIYFEMKSYLNEDEETKFFPFAKSFVLFNLEQIDNLDQSKLKDAENPLNGIEFNPIDEAEKMIHAIGVPISHGGNRAYYSITNDKITLPTQKAFLKSEMYYAVALHEVTHATGHESRLNREFGKRFGDHAYAFEELIAELGAAFLYSTLNLKVDMMQHHAGYIQSWLKILRNDKNAIFTAANRANQAFNYVLDATYKKAA